MTDHWQSYDPEVQPPYTRTSCPNGRFPRLRDEESRVLDSYLDEQGRESIDRLRTAVPVGEGEVDGQPANKFQAQKKALSQWKIDVVIDYPGRQEIIELKSRATHTAVGQALAYDVALGKRDNEPTSSRPAVVAFRAHPDLPEFARMVGVQLHTVPQADTSTATSRFLNDVGRLDDL